MAIPNVNGFRVKKGNETGITKIATDAILDKAVTKAKLSQPVQTEVNKIANKADVDGTYDSFTSGGAKQLLSTVYVDDNEPYNFRTAGGSADIGDRVTEEVVGGTVVWNQLTNKTSASGTAGVEVTLVTANKVLINGTTTGDIGYVPVAPTAQKSVIDHVYYAVCYSSDANLTKSQVRVYNDNGGVDTANSMSVWQDGGWHRIAKSTKLASWYIRLQQNTTFDNVTVGFQAFDLTQMFGSAIADYILSLEQGTAGAGVGWFRKLFPKPYYEYNTGELMSVKAGSHDTVGFNQLNDVSIENLTGVSKVANGWSATMGAWHSQTNITGWENIDYIKGMVYCASAKITPPSGATSVRVQFEYTDGTHSAGNSFNGGATGVSIATSDANKEIRCVHITYGAGADGAQIVSDLCIHLAWDGERNGEYEPYEKHEYPLAELELRGIPKLDANNQLYYDGDTYASDGTVTRKYGIVDLGTLKWYFEATEHSRFYAVLSDVALNTLNLWCYKYDPATVSQIYSHTKDLTIGAHGSAHQIWIYDSSYESGLGQGEAPSFKTAMSGVYLVYELTTPTTETADTYVNPQVVDDFGTEEYVDYAVEAGDRDVAIPVGHNSQYMNNLRAKLEMAPDSPSGDGKYIVQQSNGENAYIPYTADGRLDAIEAKLPAPPSANGTYKLTATVTDGGVTYTWVAG